MAMDGLATLVGFLVTESLLIWLWGLALLTWPAAGLKP